ncbi:uncharacterized protein LOC143290768 isoform X2 [Babylonia areolata]
MMYGEKKQQLQRPKEQQIRLVSKKIPAKNFKKIERCYLMPMGPEYQVPTRQIQYYHPSPHQPSYTQRKLRPVRDVPPTTYKPRNYRLTQTNYGYGFLFVPKAAHTTPSASSWSQKSGESANNAYSIPPAAGVAVLPPVLGTTPKSEPRKKPADKSTSSMGTRRFLMPERFAGNGLYIIRDYHSTAPTFRHSTINMYRNPKPLPFREYNYRLVYDGGRPVGHRIQRRQGQRAAVKRHAPVHEDKAAAVPSTAVVVAPVSKPAKQKDPVPEDRREDPQEEPSEEPPQAHVVAAAAVVSEPSREKAVEEKQASPAPAQHQASRQSPPPPSLPPDTTPVNSGVIAGAALGGAAVVGAAAATTVAATRKSAAPSPQPAPQPAPQQNPSSQGSTVVPPVPVLAGATAGAALGAAALSSTSTSKPAQEPQQASPAQTVSAPGPPSQPPGPEAKAAVPIAAASAAAAQKTTAAAPPAPQTPAMSGALGSIQRSLLIFG